MLYLAEPNIFEVFLFNLLLDGRLFCSLSLIIVAKSNSKNSSTLLIFSFLKLNPYVKTHPLQRYH